MSESTGDFNQQIIDEFRANGGVVGKPVNFGPTLLLLHHRGASTGTAYLTPLRRFDDPDGWLVIGSNGGAATDPAWVANLRAHPDTEVEVAADGEVATTGVHAEFVDDAEYDTYLQRVLDGEPGFAEYQSKAAPRVLPLIRLIRHADRPA